MSSTCVKKIEETCELAKNELSKVQIRNQKYYNRRTRERKLHVGDSVLLLLPTEQNKLILAWRCPYKLVGTVGEVDYKIKINPCKLKTYHINMLKRYFHRENEQKDVLRNIDKGKQEARITNGVGSKNQQINQAASVACVLEDEETDEPVAVNDANTLPLYNLKQKEIVKDVIINSSDVVLEARDWPRGASKPIFMVLALASGPMALASKVQALRSALTIFCHHHQTHGPTTSYY